MGRRKKNATDDTATHTPETEGYEPEVDDTLEPEMSDKKKNDDTESEESHAPAAVDTAVASDVDGGSEGGDLAAEADAAKKPSGDAASAVDPSTDAKDLHAEAATSSTDEPETTGLEDVALPGVVDTADLTVKDQEGKLMDDSHTSVSPDVSDEALTQDHGEQVHDAQHDATSTDDGSVVAEAAKAAEPTDTSEDEPKPASAAPIDPATLPGMAPVAAIGAIEAQGQMAPPATAIDGLSLETEVPVLGEVQAAAQPIAEILDPTLIKELKAAGDCTSQVLHSVRTAERDLAGLPDDARAIASHIRVMGLHFVAALEAMFKRS